MQWWHSPSAPRASLRRIVRDDVRFVSLHKPPGHGFKLYPRLYRLFRELRPQFVHTRNLAALEAVVPARAAGVPARVHGGARLGRLRPRRDAAQVPMAAARLQPLR